MADVALTAALRSNLLSLQGTQKLLDQTQIRLATGRKVNSALDNPNAFFAAQSLTNRAGDLSRLLDGQGQALQVLKATDEGIKALTDLVEQAQATAQEARDQATGGATVLGTNSFTAAEAADIVGQTAIADGDDFTIRLGAAGNPVTTITIEDGDTLQDIADDLNTIDGITASVVESTVTADEFVLRIQSTNGEDITLANVTNTPITTLGIASAVATTGAPEDQVSLEATYNEILAQIDTLVTDAGYRGTNLLDSSSLTVNFNEDGSSSLTISGVDFTSSGLNISAAAFSSIANIDSALDEIEAALTTIRAQSRTFGTNLSIIQGREEFTSSLINVLQEGSDKLTLADQNEEGAKLLSLQTAQQLGITSLALASQAQQSVLRLF